MSASEPKRYDIDHRVEKGQAILLTGGASLRMGTDKARLLVQGRPLGPRLAAILCDAGFEPTILGREPIEPYAFLADQADFRGPLQALRSFIPSRDMIFVLSCDVPCFHADVPSRFAGLIAGYEAVIPMIDGRPQPLCALYRDNAFSKINLCSTERVLDWVESLRVLYLSESALADASIDPKCVTGANTPHAFQALTAHLT